MPYLCLQIKETCSLLYNSLFLTTISSPWRTLTMDAPRAWDTLPTAPHTYVWCLASLYQVIEITSFAPRLSLSQVLFLNYWSLQVQLVAPPEVLSYLSCACFHFIVSVVQYFICLVSSSYCNPCCSLFWLARTIASFSPLPLFEPYKRFSFSTSAKNPVHKNILYAFEEIFVTIYSILTDENNITCWNS